MPLVKILIDYDNSSNWKKDDIVDVTDPWRLIEEGKVLLVDEKGNEIPPPRKVAQCPICIYKTTDPYDLADHIQTHKKKVVESVPAKPTIAEEPIKEETVVATPVAKSFQDMTPEERKAWRVENLRKGREAAKFKKEAKLPAEVMKEVAVNG